MKLSAIALYLTTIGWAVPVLAANSQEKAAAETIDLRPDFDRTGPKFEGWGTALAWFAHVTGGWPKAERERLADLLYSQKGLRWNIARYNIGGGSSPDDRNYLRVGADVPGFWRRPAGVTGKNWWRPDNPAMWNWDADRNQRWWLGAIRKRVNNPIFEAFSNSPPYFMTVSGRVTGNIDGMQNNLRPGYEPTFANYLVRVVGMLQQREHITFRTLSPINEPGTSYWHFTNTQEGSHWTPAAQARMIEAVAATLHAKGLATKVAAPDETSSQLFLADWSAYPERVKLIIGQINVHSYGNERQAAVRKIAEAYGIRLWMSENDTPKRGDPEDLKGMATPLVFAEHVIRDLRDLKPSAWVFWQAVENFSAREGKRGSNWGLIKADLASGPNENHRISITKKYWAMAQFSRYIRPGDRLLDLEEPQSVGAISPDGRRVVLITVNSRNVTIEPKLPDGWHSAMIVTDRNHNATCFVNRIVPAQSIATIVLFKDIWRNPCA